MNHNYTQRQHIMMLYIHVLHTFITIFTRYFLLDIFNVLNYVL